MITAPKYTVLCERRHRRARRLLGRHALPPPLRDLHAHRARRRTNPQTGSITQPRTLLPIFNRARRLCRRGPGRRPRRQTRGRLRRRAWPLRARSPVCEDRVRLLRVRAPPGGVFGVAVRVPGVPHHDSAKALGAAVVVDDLGELGRRDVVHLARVGAVGG